MLDRKWKWIAAAAILGMANTAYAGCFNPKLVTQALKETVGTTHKPIVVAHRGLWAGDKTNSLPENSLSALKAADRKCIEAVELDVRKTQDNVPFLMHDFTLGRTTNAYEVLGGPKFIPEKNTGTNPKSGDLPWATIKNLKLLSPDRNSVTAEKVVSIKEVYDYYYEQRMSTVLVFDIKSKESAIAIAKLIDEDTRDYGAGIKASDITIFKIKATMYPFPNEFVQDLNQHNIAVQPMVMPIYTTNMLQEFQDKGWNISDSLQTWITRDKMAEINLKQPKGLLSNLVQTAHDAKVALGNFNAIPDYNGPGPIPKDIPRNKAFYDSNGTCCYQLSERYATFEGVSDTDDRRGDRTFLFGQKSQHFSVITTDAPTKTINELENLGLRNTQNYGGPQANVAILAWDGEPGGQIWGDGPVCIFDHPTSVTEPHPTLNAGYAWMYACALAQPYRAGYSAELVINAIDPTADSQFGSDGIGTRIQIKDKTGKCLNYDISSTETFFDTNCSGAFATFFRTKDKHIRTSANEGYCLGSRRGGLYWANEYGVTYIAGCEIKDVWQKWLFTKDPWTYTPLPN
ncbi:glycerophosphodiester phosphodiesterase family protein [Vibrio nigripulchritudo]|uniref:glycerophosphodiester phosphodiesterase family protein n=1 Tax=Vibrio nigripulchritudo TaxID=28173 RepID=UPI0003B1830C|nr:glycerophosphodiester phosphodiesterase family protein [Vibrio nigripulchritudo]CCN69610.1 putative Glycerophosphoryl diester phosphodiesterase [Vibrio nigripulchritudo SFn118]